MVGNWRTRVEHEARRLRGEWRAALAWSLRITVAATASYVVALVIFPGTQPLLAPLTAMLVVQVTPVSLLASGLDRVVAVVLGVALAAGFAAVVPLTWWSLALLIFISITVGQLFRLRANLIEVAISGMLVLGVGSLAAGSAAWQRIAETLVGAAVGVAANLLIPPRIPTVGAGRAIEGLSDALGELLDRSARTLDRLEADPDAHDTLPSAAEAWLDEARRITHHEVPRVGALLLQAEQGRRLNVRAVALPDVGPGLRHGLESLEHTAVALRSLYRALADATSRGQWREPGGDRLLRALGEVLGELSAAVDAFGELVRLEAAPVRESAPADFRALREAVGRMPRARARLEELEPLDDPELRELHAAAQLTVRRVQRELDLAHRVRRQLQLAPARRPRPAPLRPPRRHPHTDAHDPSPDAETQALDLGDDPPPSHS
ncbi:FUSC family protein [Nocardioides ferulae]|uniref:FUSC family protein n=1 Tax=Nocardioides ferulae TaxID=2340821 RepID=UPI000EACF0A5|nr:FUSC family protein [Nocardioides ferulae]